LTGYRYGRAQFSSLVITSRQYLGNYTDYLRLKSREELGHFSSEFETVKLLSQWIWKESSIIEHYFLSGRPEVARQTIRISPFWLGVSSIYLAGSFVISPVSAAFAAVLRVPVGLFLLYAVNPIGSGIRNEFSIKRLLAVAETSFLLSTKSVASIIACQVSSFFGKVSRYTSKLSQLSHSFALNAQVTGAMSLVFERASLPSTEPADVA
jgi:hypothetical protein